jgi:uncharacterized protein YecT (DUF1311 family)
MKARFMFVAAGLAVLAPAAAAQPGPSFDCSKAEHEIEELICKDDGLAAEDRKLAEVYAAAVKAMEGVASGGPEAIQKLKTTQRGWIGVASPSGSGTRHDADFGVFFQIQGDDAQVAWPQGNEFSRTMRK